MDPLMSYIFNVQCAAYKPLNNVPSFPKHLFHKLFAYASRRVSRHKSATNYIMLNSCLNTLLCHETHYAADTLTPGVSILKQAFYSASVGLLDMIHRSSRSGSLHIHGPLCTVTSKTNACYHSVYWSGVSCFKSSGRAVGWPDNNNKKMQYTNGLVQ